MIPAVLKCKGLSEFPTPERCSILEISNSASDPSVYSARAKVAPGVTTVLHSLDQIEERYIIAAGTGLMEIGKVGPEAVEAGDVVLVPAGVPQRVTNTGQMDLIFYCVCTPRFQPSAYRQLE